MSKIKKDILEKGLHKLTNGLMDKGKDYKEMYEKTKNDQMENIELFILMYGTKDLEEILNKIFEGHNIEKIKIKLNYKIGKRFGISPII